MKKLIPLLLVAFSLSANADVRNADAQMFPPDVPYRSDIPTPRDFLGFELGTQPVRHHQLVDVSLRR